MSVNSIAVGRLPDLRLQLFAERDGELWSTWKTSIDPSSAWAPWSPFAPNNDEDFVSFSLGAAAQLPNDELLLYALGGEPNEINVLGGPALATTRKTDPGADASWTAWEPFWAGSFGPPGSPATAAQSVVVAPLSNSQLQVVFFEAPVGGSGPAPTRLWTSWTKGDSSDPQWLPVQQFVPAPPGPLAPLTMGPLAFPGTQIWGNGPEGLMTTWKARGADSPWTDWSAFQQLPDDTSAAAMAVALLPDKRAQLFAAGRDGGTVYTCWKESVATDAPWTAWQQFLGTDIVALAVAPLSDERLQLWGLDRLGELFSTWKQNSRSQRRLVGLDRVPDSMSGSIVCDESAGRRCVV